MYIRERKRGRDTSRGRGKLHAGSLMWDSILGLQDHALGQRQVLKPLGHPGIPDYISFLKDPGPGPIPDQLSKNFLKFGLKH